MLWKCEELNSLIYTRFYRLNYLIWFINSTVSNDNARVPIIAAARRGNLSLVEECLEKGVSVNALDKSGSSALHAAAQGGHLEIVQHLLAQPKIEINLQVGYL